MDLCLLNPENLNIEQTRLFHVSTFLVVDWVLKNLSYSWCGLNRVCRSTLLICVWQIKFFNTKQVPVFSTISVLLNCFFIKRNGKIDVLQDILTLQLGMKSWHNSANATRCQTQFARLLSQAHMLKINRDHSARLVSSNRENFRILTVRRYDTFSLRGGH